MRVVQIRRNDVRRVAVVEGEQLRLCSGAGSVYEFAGEALRSGRALSEVLEQAKSSEALGYEPIYKDASEWRLLPAFDHPTDAAHCRVSGTGLTHKASAENRSAMHENVQPEITDSLRMYQMGLAGGSPPEGSVGVQPEWFYKGDGSVLRGHGDALLVPEYAEDGGEEPEVAGAYLVSDTGEVVRVGFMIGNEFSDHRMEKRNYLYLAPSKLRNCAVGPELTIGPFDFGELRGTVKIVRGGEVLWATDIRSGESNMCHSLRNLEHHHFKYAAHRQPGDVHVHFFGADAFSFGKGIALEEGDVMEVAFPSLGRPLKNRVTISPKPESLVSVRNLG